MHRKLPTGTKIQFQRGPFRLVGEVLARYLDPMDDHVVYEVLDRQGCTVCVYPHEVLEVLP